jgi:glutathione S-transferase
MEVAQFVHEGVPEFRPPLLKQLSPDGEFAAGLCVAAAPSTHLSQQWQELNGGFGEAVYPFLTVRRIGRAAEQAGGGKAFKAISEDVGGDALFAFAMELAVGAAVAEHNVTNDDEAPWIAEHFERQIYWAAGAAVLCHVISLYLHYASGLGRVQARTADAGRISMSLALYGHHFSSYTQKALIALYENETPFRFRNLSHETPENSAEWAARWPLKKFPMLLDGDKQVAETSIIIEYLQLKYPGPVQLIPSDPMAALDVRFMDRFFDLHIMDAMQIAVFAKSGHLPMKPEDGMAQSVAKLEPAYAWLDGYLKGRTWAVGESYSLADAAASPSLFYADWVHEISETFQNLRAYRVRLLARPSFARAVDEARYFRHFFPLGAPDRD